ncbi:MAG: alkaline phosphatase family protein [Planctomycetota bacterium]
MSHSPAVLMRAPRRTVGALLAMVASALIGLTPALGASEPSQFSEGRVLVLGFDGADWRTTERMMDEGELPNLAALREAGTAGPLISTDPAESAAGWAAINTGANPARNGVPSFIKRTFFGSTPGANFAHVAPVTRPVAEMDVEGTVAVLSGGGSSQSILIGVGVLVVAFLLFKGLLRAGTVLSLLLAALLGAAAGYALRSASGSLPEEVPVVENKVRADGFWVEAARAGHPSVALQAPLAFDRPGAPGARTLYGLGLPDVRNSLNGDWYLYTTDTLVSAPPPKGDTRSSSSGTGVIYRVDFRKSKETGERAIETSLFGPVNWVERDRLKRELAELEEAAANAEDYASSREIVEQQEVVEKALAELGRDPGFGTKEDKHRATVPLRVVALEGGSYDVTIDGVSQTLDDGAWSDFYSVGFELGPLVTVNAVTRVRIVDTDPFQLYVDTLQYDPAEPSFWQPSSSPLGFSADVAAQIGSPYETLGWGCMTNQLKDELLDVDVFLEDVEFTMTYRRKILERMLEDGDWRVLYSVFSTTDRVQHMMYRYYDTEHPQYDAEDASEKVAFFGEEIELRDAIPAIYRQMDDIVGYVVATLGPDDTLMLCADHGFTSYRRGMHVNNWLESEGFLTLKEGAQRGDSGGYRAVDWSKTKAYALGLGMVYLNLEGREPNGIVPESEARAVLDDISARVLAARDEGVRVGSSATIIQDVYEGPEPWGSADFPCADLMLGFAENYRVSWSTVDGSMPLQETEGVVSPKPVYQDNTNLWSGDHASNDPNVVSGIFFCNRPVASADGTFSVMDIAPTVLARLGAELPSGLDRPPLRFD